LHIAILLINYLKKALYSTLLIFNLYSKVNSALITSKQEICKYEVCWETEILMHAVMATHCM